MKKGGKKLLLLRIHRIICSVCVSLYFLLINAVHSLQIAHINTTCVPNIRHEIQNYESHSARRNTIGPHAFERNIFILKYCKWKIAMRCCSILSTNLHLLVRHCALCEKLNVDFSTTDAFVHLKVSGTIWTKICLPSMKSSSVCARFCIRPRQFFDFDVAASRVVVVVAVGIVVVLALQLALNVLQFNSFGLNGCDAVSA